MTDAKKMIDSSGNKPKFPRALPIYTYNHPVLREKSIPVSEFTSDIEQLCIDMLYTMSHCNGLGLAANQVGSNHSIIVVDAYTDNRTRRGIVLINPEITWSEDLSVFGNEGCLSFPTLSVEVKRARNITVKYRDERFEEQEYMTNKPYFEWDENGDTEEPRLNPADVLLARIIQHEIDHLNQIILVDYMIPPLDPELQRQLSKIEKGHMNVKYNTIHK